MAALVWDAWQRTFKNWREYFRGEYEIDILYLEDFEAVRTTPAFNKKINDIQNNPTSNKNIINDSIYYKDRNAPIFDHKKYDGIYIFYHLALCDNRLLSTPIPFHKLAVAINNEKWVDDGAKNSYNNYFEGVRVLSVCNSYIENAFKSHHPCVMRVSQTVNEKVFFNMRNRFSINNKNFRVGWSGNPNNPYKNFELVKDSVSLAQDARLFVAKNMTRELLNEWYSKLDMTLCLSRSEGGPLMLLESGACGIPIISASVGLAREIIIDGKTGLVTDLNKESVFKLINRLANDRAEREFLAKNLYNEIHQNWTYQNRLYEIRNVFEEITKS
jgi:glycosyltransferase involved in cell wall biosynthesis